MLGAVILESNRNPIRKGRTIAQIQALFEGMLEEGLSTTKMAARLGVSPNSVQRWLKQFGYKFDHDKQAWVNQDEEK